MPHGMILCKGQVMVLVLKRRRGKIRASGENGMGKWAMGTDKADGERALITVCKGTVVCCFCILQRM